MPTYIDAYNGDKSIPLFLAFAIEQYKKHRNIPGEEAADILERTGVLKHLEEYFDVLHTQSAQWLMEEIDEMVENYQRNK